MKQTKQKEVAQCKRHGVALAEGNPDHKKEGLGEGKKIRGAPSRFLEGIVAIVWVAFVQNTSCLMGMGVVASTPNGQKPFGPTFVPSISSLRP